jgi:hypothetical protein
MDRATTREEYKAFMRRWRAAFAHTLPFGGKDMWADDVSKQAHNDVFHAIYAVVPKDYWNFRDEVFRHVYEAKESCGLLLNVKYAPNSYPHKTRNP